MLRFAPAETSEPLDLYRITDRISVCGREVEKIEEDPQLTECPRPIPFTLASVDHATGNCEESDVTMPCGRKRCPFCGPHLRRRYLGHFTRVFSALPGLHFITLTLDPKVGIETDDARKYLLYAWSMFRKRVHRMAKAVESTFHFCAVPEEHESGYYHLHVLASVQLDEAALRSAWFQVGGGIVMDVQAIDKKALQVERVVGYILKYVFKDAGKARGSISRRSLLCSRGLSYHSMVAVEERKEWLARQGMIHVGDAHGGHFEYVSQIDSPGAPQYEDTLTSDDICRFSCFAAIQKRTTLYLHEHGSQRALHWWDGREMRSERVEQSATRRQVAALIHRVRKRQEAAHV